MSDRRDDRTERGDPTTAESREEDPEEQIDNPERQEDNSDETVEHSERTKKRAETTTEVSSGEGDPSGGDGEGDDSGGSSGGLRVAIAAVVALAVTALTYLWVSGWFGMTTFYESMFRVAPTVSGGGVGTDWVVGNTVPWLDAAIAVTHAADVIMGMFILGMVFLHWAIFRRLSTRMRRPTRTETGGAVAADGGRGADGDARTDGGDAGGDRP